MLAACLAAFWALSIAVVDALMACCAETREQPIGRAVDEIVSLICPDRGRMPGDVLLLGVEV